MVKTIADAFPGPCDSTNRGGASKVVVKADVVHVVTDEFAVVVVLKADVDHVVTDELAVVVVG